MSSFSSGQKYGNVWVKMGDEKLWERVTKKILGTEIGTNPNFDDYVFPLCKKARRKLIVLATLFKFMRFKQKRILMKIFAESQFGYCPLIWIFHSRKRHFFMRHFSTKICGL